MAKNGVKGLKKSENNGQFSPCLIGLFAPRFFWPFSPTAELGPRLECLHEYNPLRKSTFEANFYRKYSPNKSNNDTFGQEGDNHVYFGVSYQILLRSQLQLEFLLNKR